jgi:hypothetical protein
MRLDKNGVIISDDDDVVVNRTEPKLDECRSLLLHIVKQAVDDYESFKMKTKEEHQEIWRSANSFIFDDDHYIKWGDKEINLDQICDLLGLNIDWVRNRISQRLELKLTKDGVLIPARKF